MLLNCSYFISILQSAVLLLTISTSAYGKSLSSFIEELEKERSAEISSFLDSINEQTQSTNPKYEKYGGELGNKYFQYYTNEIIHPALIKYIEYLKNTPKEKASNKKDIFVNLVDELGNVRQKIAIKTQSKEASSFGKKTNMLTETIAYGTTNDPSWLSWLKYLQYGFGVDDIDFSKSPTLQDVLNSTAQFIRTNGSKDLVTSIDNIFLRVRNESSSYRTGSYSIELLSDPLSNNPYEGVTGDLKINNKNHIQFTFFHTVALYDNLSRLFFASLDSKLLSDQLLHAIGRFLFSWSQAAIYARGQAAVGEWIIHALAGSAGYKLNFSETWQGKNNGSMAPNMYAVSYLDEKEFMEHFTANASLEPNS